MISLSEQGRLTAEYAILNHERQTLETDGTMLRQRIHDELDLL